MDINNDKCPICSRELGDVKINRHHLVPKSRKGKDQYKIHEICHRKIHATFTIKELEQVFHTWDELKSHPDIQKFIEWVQNKPLDFYDNSVTAHRRRK
jgi:5-methylcytosine-specific restriction endonuclease McrA